MLDILFWIGVGAFVGWNMPQPSYAKWIQEWFMDKLKSFSNNTSEK